MWSSTARVKSLPNVAELTFDVFRIVSERFNPVRALS